MKEKIEEILLTFLFVVISVNLDISNEFEAHIQLKITTFFRLTFPKFV